MSALDLTHPSFPSPIFKMPTSVTLKAKVSKPCKKLLQVLKFKVKKPIITPFLAFRKLRRIRGRPRGISLGCHSWFKRSVRGKKKKMENEDQVGKLMSFPELGTQEKERLLFPSPLTPAYIRAAANLQSGTAGVRDEAVEDACRSFENYLVEMIVEEGKVRDLTDVEELLYCWRNLKCPVFHELVCRFYGELCMDLFSNSEYYEHDETQESH